MIDLDLLRKEPELLRSELKKRGKEESLLDDVLELDEVRREGIAELEQLKASQNKLSQQVAQADAAARTTLIEQARELAAKIKALQPKIDQDNTSFTALVAQLPNLAHATVPTGVSAADNTVDGIYGDKPLFDFVPKAHWQLAESMGLLDGKRGAKVAGSRFNFVLGDLVKLEFALHRFVMGELAQRGFTPVLPPTLVKKDAMFGAGMFPVDTDEVYAIPKDALYLAGTSEIPLLSYHAHETVDVAQEPIRYAGFTTNFRREAGSYGKDVRGMIRTHQFDKIEMFVYISQAQSWDYFEGELLSIAEGILQKLGLHFRRVILSTGDLPYKFQKTYDLECWLPSENRYLETNSISHAGDFQARRLGIKYGDSQGHRRYVHTLNATAAAFSRLPVVLMEQYQTAEGKVRIPEVLQPLMDNQEYLGRVSSTHR